MSNSETDNALLDVVPPFLVRAARPCDGHNVVETQIPTEEVS